jgi:hypothetical protein
MHVDCFGRYETPRFQLGQKVRHIATGVHCEVVGFLAWKEPIILYYVQTIDGNFEPEVDRWLSQTEIEAYE